MLWLCCIFISFLSTETFAFSFRGGDANSMADNSFCIASGPRWILWEFSVSISCICVMYACMLCYHCMHMYACVCVHVCDRVHAYMCYQLSMWRYVYIITKIEMSSVYVCVCERVYRYRMPGGTRCSRYGVDYIFEINSKVVIRMRAARRRAFWTVDEI